MNLKFAMRWPWKGGELQIRHTSIIRLGALLLGLGLMGFEAATIVISLLDPAVSQQYRAVLSRAAATLLAVTRRAGGSGGRPPTSPPCPSLPRSRISTTGRSACCCRTGRPRRIGRPMAASQPERAHGDHAAGPSGADGCCVDRRGLRAPPHRCPRHRNRDRDQARSRRQAGAAGEGRDRADDHVQDRPAASRDPDRAHYAGHPAAALAAGAERQRRPAILGLVLRRIDRR